MIVNDTEDIDKRPRCMMYHVRTKLKLVGMKKMSTPIK